MGKSHRPPPTPHNDSLGGVPSLPRDSRPGASVPEEYQSSENLPQSRSCNDTYLGAFMEKDIWIMNPLCPQVLKAAQGNQGWQAPRVPSNS